MLLIIPAAQVVADRETSSSLVIEEASVLYEARKYKLAVDLLTKELEREPTCAGCAHQLGRAYGRLAENASWIAAIGLAKKTRIAFENAVELDPLNEQALQDLIQFYREAPGFLGGGADKANNLESRLNKLRAENSSSNVPPTSSPSQ